MLNELTITNLGVIESATAEFASGLSVVTGETGAGKTMVVSSLRLLSGTRADASRVRIGAEKATVDGIFTTAIPDVSTLVDEIGGTVDPLDDEQIEVVASRTIQATGRSKAHLAGKTVAAGLLHDFAGHVITIHGQNDQLRLLEAGTQRSTLDHFAGCTALTTRFGEERQAWLAAQAELRRRKKQRRELALEAETLQRGIDLISEINPEPGEDERIKSDITRLQDADDLMTGLTTAMNSLDGTGGAPGGIDGFDDASLADDATSAVDALADAGRALDGLPHSDDEIEELRRRVGELSDTINDLAQDIGHLRAGIPDPSQLEELLQRQQQLRELRKYAPDVDGALEWKADAEVRLAGMDVSDEAIAGLEAEVERTLTTLRATAKELHEARTTAASALGTAVTEEIRGLHMQARIEVTVTFHDPAERAPLPDGCDEVDFMLIQGGNPQPLASSASGGELSRIMLALEVILAESGRTMVFDEVDAGVGGKAAVEIGRRLAALAMNNQVIVVTHLPQVAAFADRHLLIDKSVTESSASSSVRHLDDSERVEELARMLAGLESDTGKAHAEELMNMAREAKEALAASASQG